MKIIYGNSADTSKIKGLKLLEFRILETVYQNGKVEIVSWEAKIE